MGAERGYRCRRHHLNCYGFHCFFCTNECDEVWMRARVRHRAHSLYFLFTRLTNVGVFVELLASAIDTLGGCGDADDDRIYNKDSSSSKKRVRKKTHQNRKITL